MNKKIFILGFAIIFALSAVASASTWEADKEHTSIGFKVKHLMISKVYGNFDDFTINLEYNEGDVPRSTLNVSIDVASIDTDNEKRDAHLKSPDFFDVENFPMMNFISKRIKQTDDGLVIIGDLTLHGITKEVTLDVEDLTEPMKGPWGNLRMGASATAKINRTDFGLKWNMPLETGGLLVGEEVDILIDVELIQKSNTAMQ